MKVLYIAPYRDGTGYSRAAQENIMALNSVSVDVVTRNAKMTPTTGAVYPEIDEFERKSLKNIDAIIQHNLPNTWSFTNKCRNIGLFAYETQNIFNPVWERHFSMVDKIGVFCNDNKRAMESVGNENKTFVVPHPVNFERFKDKSIDTIDFGLPKNCTIFYTIGELVPRKNYYSLLFAYFSTFSRNDNVCLVIKSQTPDKNSERTKAEFQRMSNDIKNALGLFADITMYPKVILLSDYMKDSEILSIHKTGTVFVSTSFGESFCLPALDAIYMGKQAILPTHTAFIDLISHTSGMDLLYLNKETKCFGYGAGYLYNGEESWIKIDTDELSSNMLKKYDNHQKGVGQLNEETIKTNKNLTEEFYSYQTVGNTLVSEIGNIK